jgi:hypothetical protein
MARRLEVGAEVHTVYKRASDERPLLQQAPASIRGANVTQKNVPALCRQFLLSIQERRTFNKESCTER